jgi:hypothetical protein
MKRSQLTFLVAVSATLLLTGCGGAPTPMPTPTASSSSSPSSSAAPTPEPTETAAPDEPDAQPALIPVRIPATCGDLADAAMRERVTGVDDASLERASFPLASGSAAELQAGVLTCQWFSSVVVEESSAEVLIKVLPDAATEFAAFEPPLSGSEVLGTLSAGSKISCYDDATVRACYVHFLAANDWVDASFTAPAPVPAGDAIAVATEFAEAIAEGLASAGPLGAAYAPPAGSLDVWSSCTVLDDLGAFRTAVASPSLTAPEAEFSGAGTLFSEAWQRVDFKSCAWRQADPYTSPAGQIRMASVLMLPGAEWAWASLREAFVARGAVEVDIVGADDATLLCSGGDDCTIEALVRGSYVSVYLSVDQSRGGASALAVTAAEFVIARL